MTKVTNEELKNQTVPKRCDRDAILTLSISTLARRGYGSTAQLRAKRIPATFGCRLFVPSCLRLGLLPPQPKPRLVYSACRQIPQRRLCRAPPEFQTAAAAADARLLVVSWSKLCSTYSGSSSALRLRFLGRGAICLLCDGSPLSRPPPGPVGSVADAWVFILRIAGRSWNHAPRTWGRKASLREVLFLSPCSFKLQMWLCALVPLAPVCGAEISVFLGVLVSSCVVALPVCSTMRFIDSVVRGEKWNCLRRYAALQLLHLSVFLSFCDE
jgi:hypothetical protein